MFKLSNVFTVAGSCILYQNNVDAIKTLVMPHQFNKENESDFVPPAPIGFVPPSPKRRQSSGIKKFRDQNINQNNPNQENQVLPPKPNSKLQNLLQRPIPSPKFPRPKSINTSRNSPSDKKTKTTPRPVIPFSTKMNQQQEQQEQVPQPPNEEDAPEGIDDISKLIDEIEFDDVFESSSSQTEVIVPTHSEDQWACASCTFLNDKDITHCEMCKTEQEQQSLSPRFDKSKIVLNGINCGRRYCHQNNKNDQWKKKMWVGLKLTLDTLKNDYKGDKAFTTIHVVLPAYLREKQFKTKLRDELIQKLQETESITFQDCDHEKDSDDWKTIQYAYENNCYFMDNDRYLKDWPFKLRQEENEKKWYGNFEKNCEVGTWLVENECRAAWRVNFPEDKFTKIVECKPKSPTQTRSLCELDENMSGVEVVGSVQGYDSSVMSESCDESTTDSDKDSDKENNEVKRTKSKSVGKKKKKKQSKEKEICKKKKEIDSGDLDALLASFQAENLEESVVSHEREIRLTPKKDSEDEIKFTEAFDDYFFVTKTKGGAKKGGLEQRYRDIFAKFGLANHYRLYYGRVILENKAQELYDSLDRLVLEATTVSAKVRIERQKDDLDTVVAVKACLDMEAVLKNKSLVFDLICAIWDRPFIVLKQVTEMEIQKCDELLKADVLKQQFEEFVIDSLNERFIDLKQVIEMEIQKCEHLLVNDEECVIDSLNERTFYKMLPRDDLCLKLSTGFFGENNEDVVNIFEKIYHEKHDTDKKQEKKTTPQIPRLDLDEVSHENFEEESQKITKSIFACNVASCGYECSDAKYLTEDGLCKTCHKKSQKKNKNKKVKNIR